MNALAQPDFSSGTNDRKAEMTEELLSLSLSVIESFSKNNIINKNMSGFRNTSILLDYLNSLSAKDRVLWNVYTIATSLNAFASIKKGETLGDSDLAFENLVFVLNNAGVLESEEWVNSVMFYNGEKIGIEKLKTGKNLSDALVSLLEDDLSTELIENSEYDENENKFLLSTAFFDKKTKDDYRSKAVELLKRGIDNFTADSISKTLNTTASKSYSIIKFLKGLDAVEESGKYNGSTVYSLKKISGLESKLFFGKQGFEPAEDIDFELDPLCTYRKNAYEIADKVEVGETIAPKDFGSDYTAFSFLTKIGVLEKTGRGKYSVISNLKTDDDLKYKIKYCSKENEEISKIQDYEAVNLILKYADYTKEDEINDSLVEKLGLSLSKNKIKKALVLIEKYGDSYLKPNYNDFKKTKENEINDVFMYELESCSKKGGVPKQEFYRKLAYYVKEKIDERLNNLEEKGYIKKIGKKENLVSAKKHKYDFPQERLNKNSVLVKKLLDETRQTYFFNAEISETSKKELKSYAEKTGCSKEIIDEFSSDYFEKNYPNSDYLYKALKKLKHDMSELYTMMSI
ncbi:MAG: hypothetical protein PHW96_00125 [Candidatus Nanoarchaeia archaeon]|nr:hypothetical protein [Candidatus Nanoarchaeia archaeon]